MKFSIVTPSYNQLEWLQLCISSVRDQLNFHKCVDLESPISIEHIIQDARSENIEELARSVGARLFVDGKLVFDGNHSIENTSLYRVTIYSEKDMGMYDAVNRGLSKATGDICAYLNCDEQYLPGALPNVQSWFENDLDLSIAAAGCLVVNDSGNLIFARYGVKPLVPHILIDYLPSFTAATFFRRSILAAPWRKFDTRFRDVADACWYIDRIRERLKIRGFKYFTSTFTLTGNNMGQNENAAAEKQYLRSSASTIIRLSRPFIILLHRVKKLFRGEYFPRSFDYSIYTKYSPNIRTHFHSERASSVWWDRLKSN